MTTETLNLHNIERKIFWILASFLGIAVLFYFYSVFTMTLAVVERDRTIASARVLASSAGDLEQEYMSIQNGITLARAEELGFREVSAKFTGGTTSDKIVAIR